MVNTGFRCLSRSLANSDNSIAADHDAILALRRGREVMAAGGFKPRR